MTRFLSLGLLAGAALVVALAVGAKADEKAKTSGLDMLKGLAGDWTGKHVGHGSDEHEASVTYKVTAGGSAVVETLFPDTEHEMVTVYHQDGKDLVLTHYCMLHNQPRMRAERDSGPHKLVFKFAGINNLKSEKDAHMHDLTLEFLGEDHIKATWNLYKDGKSAEKTTLDLKRKKK